MKTCVHCGETKPLEAFPFRHDKRWSTGGSYRAHCKACRPTVAKDRQPEARKRERALVAERKGRAYLTDEAYHARARARAEQRALRSARVELRRLLRALYLVRCREQDANPWTVKYRLRYQNDAAFRAHEIARRQARDYPTLVDDGTLTARVLASLFAAAKECTYCERPMRSEEKTLDHIVPRSRGGRHSIANVVVCCKSCNSRKHDAPLGVWLERLRAQRRTQVA